MFLRNRGHRWAALIAGVSAAATQARGVELTDLLAFNAGPLLLRPHVGIQEQYNDNVFYQPSRLGPSADFISTINPGLTVSLGKEEIKSALSESTLAVPLGIVTEEQPNFISVDYSAASHFYAKRSNLDSTDHFISIRDRLKGQRLKLEGTDSILSLTGVIGQGYNLGNAIINRMAYADTYTLSYKVSEKTSTYAVASYSATEYAPGTPLYSINTMQGTWGFAARLLPKTSFFGELYYGQTAVRPASPSLPDGPHTDSSGGFVGVMGKFTEKFSGRVKVGYEVQTFSNHASGLSAPVVEASLNERFSEKTSLSLNYTRHGYVSVQAISIGFIADTAGLRLDQVLGQTGKVMATLAANYSMFEYGSSGFYAHRTDNVFNANASLNYKFNLWMTGSVGYEFEKFASNYLPSVIDYSANRATLKLTVGY